MRKPFDETLKQIRAGLLLNEAAEKLQEVVTAVDATGKQGEFILKLTIKKIGRTGTMEIADKVTTKVPQEAPVTTMMFVTPEGNLLTEDPRQTKLDIERVESKPKEKVLKIV
ncbi:hypothetical protein [Pelistega ratti]|uniref:hypothetical protein n=1 Tax=Pelistega ratti TaxID=2652177 RepID=UPI00135B1531|nr:hypothetical protein [Pelistega ratti]